MSLVHWFISQAKPSPTPWPGRSVAGVAPSPHLQPGGGGADACHRLIGHWCSAPAAGLIAVQSGARHWQRHFAALVPSVIGHLSSDNGVVPPPQLIAGSCWALTIGCETSPPSVPRPSVLRHRSPDIGVLPPPAVLLQCRVVVGRSPMAVHPAIIHWLPNWLCAPLLPYRGCCWAFPMPLSSPSSALRPYRFVPTARPITSVSALFASYCRRPQHWLVGSSVFHVELTRSYGYRI
jgi:hypothetical protein